MKSLIYKFMKEKEASTKSIIGPNLWFLHIFGVWDPKNCKTNILFYLFVFQCVCYVPSQFFELWVLRNNQYEAMKNMSYTFESFILHVKAASMLYCRKQWSQVITYIWELERQEEFEGRDQINKRIIESYRKHIRLMTYLFWSLALYTVPAVIIAPIIGGYIFTDSRNRILNGTDPYPEVMSSWVPFDKRFHFWGFLATAILHTEVFITAGIIVVNYDSTIFGLMTVLSGQLKVLKRKCENIFNMEPDCSPSNVAGRIENCFHHHENLVKHCNILNSLLSPIMFVYITISSIMICASVMMATDSNTPTVQQIWLALYTVTVTIELFFYCWHSNEVYFSSLDVSYGAMSSAWWNFDTSYRRSLILLIGKLRKTIVFTAGPFAALNIVTFISILKAAYSYYTLFKNSH